ncbi:hypothetical protein [Actinophytocola sp. NPDC049390]|uniref:hypothetical protein n=1 Tax=Actinophytocola sp. NPDC049390 TaxID=3363894 RepID=UPI0037A49240
MISVAYSEARGLAMGSTTQRSNRRKRGNIETLRSGARRIRVYNGRDPITKRPIYVGETIPVGTPDLDKAAERALTRGSSGSMTRRHRGPTRPSIS